MAMFDQPPKHPWRQAFTEQQLHEIQTAEYYASLKKFYVESSDLRTVVARLTFILDSLAEQGVNIPEVYAQSIRDNYERRSEG